MLKKICAHPGCASRVDIGRSRCPSHEAQGQKDRWARTDAARRPAPWRKWYKTKAWKALRAETLKRDLWTCQWLGCGVTLTTGRIKPNAAVVDHKVPHRGNRALFFSEKNVWALCKRCHDSRKQAEERAAGR